MIEPSKEFDLGLDKDRIKDPREAERQLETVSCILERFYDPQSEHSWHLQLLADEVGMGKTFVALGAAYSLLRHMNAAKPGDLKGCCSKVLVITPQNTGLFRKWSREVSEFVRRCVRHEFRKEAANWFKAVEAHRIDELAAALRGKDKTPKVIVTHMGVFSAKLQNYELKRRLLLGLIFRYWGNRFRVDQRKRLLKGSPDGWPQDPYQLADIDDEDHRFNFRENEIMKALQILDLPGIDNAPSPLEFLLEKCRKISEPYTRGREDLFGEVETKLTSLYRDLCGCMIDKYIPLVIVDEAHNWKNGPSGGVNGYKEFRKTIAPKTRRALLMTATPFQLRPQEMLELLKIGEHLTPSPKVSQSLQERDRIRRQRKDVIGPVLDNSAKASVLFERAWSGLPKSISSAELEAVWADEALVEVRRKLEKIATEAGVVDHAEMERLIDEAARALDPRLREIIREGLRLFTYNSDLSQELGEFVIRHRRDTDHRLFRVGDEYKKQTKEVAGRPDRHQIHLADGIDVKGEGELPHYLLMRCVSEMKWADKGHGRSSLGCALTGCYSTLLESAEGRQINKDLGKLPLGRVYLDLLKSTVNKKQDPKHPKMEAVVEFAVSRWLDGEKTLIFCFRTNTAERLRDILNDRIRREMKRRTKDCLGSPENLASLKKRFTGRQQDLVPVGLDRVIWSLIWNEKSGLCTNPESLVLRDEELPHLVRLGLRYGVDMASDKLDRVFLNRVVEHILARRLVSEAVPHSLAEIVLRAMIDQNWIARPYGVEQVEESEEGGEESSGFDEKGVHFAYEVKNPSLSDDDVRRLAEDLAERRNNARRRGQTPVLDSYAEGPSLWLGPRHLELYTQYGAATSEPQLLKTLHKNLWAIVLQDGEVDWLGRLKVLQALRRALIRDSVLVRLLPGKSDHDESGRAELLVRSFFKSLPGQRESMADRVTVFLEDLRAASGSLHEKRSARYSLFDSTRLRDQQFVALVKGGTDTETRERIFSGFNTPLLPEILVCTSVGQEGIDLHRHCRHVIHYDLAWNPAVLEQRTGRTDRIGSKISRERERKKTVSIEGPYLEIGVPFLAGTYDERMFEEVRVRAQVFEVLTGGNLNTDSAEGFDDAEGAEGASLDKVMTPLPRAMVDDLRVKLNIWSDKPAQLAAD